MAKGSKELSSFILQTLSGWFDGWKSPMCIGSIGKVSPCDFQCKLSAKTTLGQARNSEGEIRLFTIQTVEQFWKYLHYILIQLLKMIKPRGGEEYWM